MTKTMRHVSEDIIEQVLEEQELDGWQLICAAQTSPASSYGGANSFSVRSFPAAYLLFFRKG